MRNGLYGLQVSRLLGVRGLRRLAAAQLTIDESTAVGVAQPEARAAGSASGPTGLAVFVLWNLMTLVGALDRRRPRRPARYGLDAAAARGLLRAALAAAEVAGTPSPSPPLAAVIAVLLAPHAPAGVPVLVAAGSALLAGLWPTAHQRPSPAAPLGR